MCIDDYVMISVNLAVDNYIESANIDGTISLPTFVQSGVYPASNDPINHTQFAPFATTTPIFLSASTSTHYLNIVVRNYNFPESTIYNPTGLNLYGQIYSADGLHSIKAENDDADCAGYSCGGDGGRHSAPTTAPTVAPIKGNLACVPNPNGGSFTLRGALSVKTTSNEASIEVVDMLGKVVYNDVAIIENGGINKVITLGDNIANGVYLIKINSGSTIKVLRVSVQR